MRMGRIRVSSAVVACSLVLSVLVHAQGKSTKSKNTKSSKSTTQASASSVDGGMCLAPETPKLVSECPANLGKAKGRIGGAPESKLRQSKRKLEKPKGFKSRYGG